MTTVMQRPFTVIRFKFHHSLHIGSHRTEYDRSDNVLHSDTFCSAVIQAYNLLGIQHPVLHNDGHDQEVSGLDFAVSSLYPFFRASKTAKPVYFFPIPLPGLQVKDRRSFKEVEWMDTIFFTRLLADNTYQPDTASIKGKWLTDIPEFKSDFLQKYVHARNFIPRVGQTDEVANLVINTGIFYIDRIYFRDHCGMFCLAQFDNDNSKELFIQALDYLKDAGLGTDRNVGYGQFEYEIEEFNDFKDMPDSEFAINLSLFCPENDQQLESFTDDDQCRWDLIKRGGWITSDERYLTYRKHAVYMFREGSILKHNNSIAGKLLNLRPDDSILPNGNAIIRTGKSLFLPIKIKQAWQ